MDDYAAVIREGKFPTNAPRCDSRCPEAQGHQFLIIFLAKGAISLSNYRQFCTPHFLLFGHLVFIVKD